jgi:glycosyltransferase involved in cell wall biosynthesis
MTRKKLLFASEVFPYPLDRGDRVRISHILEACARDYDVTFVGPHPLDSLAPEIPHTIRQFILFDQNEAIGFEPRLWLAALRSRIGLPLSRNLFRRIRFLKALQKVDVSDFDVIWAERPDVGVFFFDVRERTVVDYDDISHRKLSRLRDIQTHFLRRLYTQYQVMVYRAAELHRFRGYKRIIVCSEDDRSYLAERGVSPVSVVRNGVLAPAHPATTRSRANGQALKAVFLGNMSHAPNADALQFCVEEILPLAGTVIASLDVIGANAPPEMQRQFGEQVRFRGFVDDIAVALQEYDVMLVPLRFGSGTKLKLLDAMAVNLPVITTDVGAEGLMLETGVSAYIANTPNEIVLALKQLSVDRESARRIAASARLLVDQHFTWSSVEDGICELLKVS